MELQLIKNTIELYSGQDITKVTRLDNIISLRIIYYKIARDLTYYSLREVGELVGKNHATVLNGVNKFEEVIRKKYYNQLYNDVLNSLNNEVALDRVAKIASAEQEESLNTEIWKLKAQLLEFEQTLNHPIFKDLLTLSDSELSDFRETRLKPYKKSLESRLYQAAGCGVKKSRWEFNN